MSEVLTGDQLVNKVSKTGMVPVYSHDDVDIIYNVVKACYEGGIRAFEYTNRSQEALEVFKKLKERTASLSGLSLGVGTIMDLDQCKSYFEAGTAFIVSPIVDKDVADFCASKQISWTPGCGTLTEIVQGERLGAKLIKVFPADVLGPKFVKSVLGPCKHLRLMPTGGVSPLDRNLKNWFDSGVTCVGMGSQLFSKDLIEKGEFHELPQKIQSTLSTIKNLKS